MITNHFICFLPTTNLFIWQVQVNIQANWAQAAKDNSFSRGRLWVLISQFGVDEGIFTLNSQGALRGILHNSSTQRHIEAWSLPSGSWMLIHGAVIHACTLCVIHPSWTLSMVGVPFPHYEAMMPTGLFQKKKKVGITVCAYMHEHTCVRTWFVCTCTYMICECTCLRTSYLNVSLINILLLYKEVRK